MKVVLPVNLRNEAWLGGTNYYLGLVRALARHPDPQGTSLVVLSNRPDAFVSVASDRIVVESAPWLDPTARADFFVNGSINIFLRYNPLLYRRAHQLRANLISHASPGRASPCPTLFWMQDFQHRYLPGYFSRYERWRRDRNVRAAASSGHILFSSQSAAVDFRRFFPESSGAIAHVLRFPPFFDQASDAGQALDDLAILSSFGLAPGYFFLPNQFWAHKNHGVVVEALRSLPGSFRVVCTGALSDSRGNDHIHRIRAAVAEHGLQDRFLMLGAVPRPRMFALMRNACCVINPSMFEGWSSTVEESKLLGKQMILSSLPVHREQNPEDARYFEPQDPDELASAMRLAAEEFDPARDRARQERAIAEYPRRIEEFAMTYWAIARSVARR